MDPDLPASASLRKVRFTPKAPPRKDRKQVVLKTDSSIQDTSDDEAPDDHLLRCVNEYHRGKPKVEKAAQVVFSPGVVSSTPLRTYGNPREGTSSGYGDLQELVRLPSNTKVEDSSDKDEDYQEPWDYDNSYYPITLPLRKPHTGDPEIQDEKDFGESARNAEYDENKIRPSSELGLLATQIDDQPKILFIQLPDNLPLYKRDIASSKKGKEVVVVPTSAKGKEKVCTKGKEIVEVQTSAKGKEKAEIPTVLRRKSNPNKGCDLEELPGGFMGKMLVYKSGAVKFKIGNILYDVSPGSDFSFPQDAIAINTADKNCCKLQGIEKHAVVTPDVDSLLDSAMDLD